MNYKILLLKSLLIINANIIRLQNMNIPTDFKTTLYDNIIINHAQRQVKLNMKDLNLSHLLKDLNFLIGTYIILPILFYLLLILQNIL